MCRTANGFDINHDEGVNPQTKDGRGNICPVTIIMPTLAMEATEIWLMKHDLDDIKKYENNRVDIFMEILDKKIHEAKDMLIERFEYICSQNPLSAKFMYENGVILGYKPEEGIRSALKHGTLALGQLGLAETLQILIGKDHTTEEGMKVAKRIEKLFKDRCAEFKQEWHYLATKPSTIDIKNKMIEIAEKELGRKLTPEELSEIESYEGDK